MLNLPDNVANVEALKKIRESGYKLSSQASGLSIKPKPSAEIADFIKAHAKEIKQLLSQDNVRQIRERVIPRLVELAESDSRLRNSISQQIDELQSIEDDAHLLLIELSRVEAKINLIRSNVL